MACSCDFNPGRTSIFGTNAAVGIFGASSSGMAGANGSEALCAESGQVVQVKRPYGDGLVPIISIFLGIIIRIFHDDHPPPHFHVEYAEHGAIVNLENGRLLAGRLPPRAARLVEEWRRLHLHRLRRCWEDAQAGKSPKRIPPLV